jgi:hypothetical protein
MTEKSLKDFVALFGIEPKEVKTIGLNIRLTGRKSRHVPPSELDRIMIYSHANTTGIGKSHISLAEARGRIRIFQK